MDNAVVVVVIVCADGRNFNFNSSRTFRPLQPKPNKNIVTQPNKWADIKTISCTIFKHVKSAETLSHKTFYDIERKPVYGDCKSAEPIHTTLNC